MIEKNTSTAFPGNVEQRDAYGVFTELSVPLELVENDEGRLLLSTRNIHFTSLLRSISGARRAYRLRPGSRWFPVHSHWKVVARSGWNLVAKAEIDIVVRFQLK
ncbi:unnamed protein product [Schistocephalus solidus]|uniref:GRAM domain-containing protein n=1 Tax=Schistocephalus solidus TaxID=70667 RepID=A0A183SN42_SCHSO|nr:unnamed protein product [Schistocephalus solidus]